MKSFLLMFTIFLACAYAFPTKDRNTRAITKRDTLLDDDSWLIDLVTTGLSTGLSTMDYYLPGELQEKLKIAGRELTKSLIKYYAAGL